MAADVWVGASTVERRGLTGVALGGAPFASVPAAIAVRKGNAALLADINRAIQAMKADGTLQRIHDRWRPEEMVFLSRERAQAIGLVGAAVVLALLLAATVVWARTLRREVRVRRDVESQLVESGRAAAAGPGRGEHGHVAVWIAARTRHAGRQSQSDARARRVESTQPLDDMFERVHPDDRNAVRSALQRAIRRARRLRQGVPHRVPGRIRPDPPWAGAGVLRRVRRAAVHHRRGRRHHRRDRGCRARPAAHARAAERERLHRDHRPVAGTSSTSTTHS